MACGANYDYLFTKIMMNVCDMIYEILNTFLSKSMKIIFYQFEVGFTGKNNSKNQNK